MTPVRDKTGRVPRFVVDIESHPPLMADQWAGGAPVVLPGFSAVELNRAQHQLVNRPGAMPLKSRNPWPKVNPDKRSD